MSKLLSTYITFFLTAFHTAAISIILINELQPDKICWRNVSVIARKKRMFHFSERHRLDESKQDSADYSVFFPSAFALAHLARARCAKQRGENLKPVNKREVSAAVKEACSIGA